MQLKIKKQVVQVDSDEIGDAGFKETEKGKRETKEIILLSKMHTQYAERCRYTKERDWRASWGGADVHLHMYFAVCAIEQRIETAKSKLKTVRSINSSD